MNIKPRTWGALFGALLGISWLIWGWRFLWVAVPVGVGYLLGRFLESREEVIEKGRDLVRVLFR